MNELSISKEISIDASKEAVFDALTNSIEIVKYYPLQEVVSDWKIGAEVLYKGETDGSRFTDFGKIESFERPNEYSYTYWSDNHGTTRVPENCQTICYKLSSVGNVTKLILEHENLQSVEQFELMNNKVWDSLLNGLKTYVESRT